MDVAATRFGGQPKGMDKLADEVFKVFKRFLEEYSDEQEDALDESRENDSQSEFGGSMRDDVTNATNDSFFSANTSQAKAINSKKKRKFGPAKYADEALLLLESDRNTLFIDFKDLETYDGNLADDIHSQYYRFYPFICRATAAYTREERIRRVEAAIEPNASVTQRMAEREQIKRDLDRAQIKNKNYYVGFYNFPHRQNIRDLSSNNIGQLTRVTGQVVRTHSVHPELLIGCFRCKDCLAEQYTTQHFRYTTPKFCVNDNCNNVNRYDLVLEKSQSTDFQRLRIQETQRELPRGCIPRSFDVIVRGSDQVECIQPGDQCDFTGTLIAMPDVGQMMNGTLGTVSSEMGSESGFMGLKMMGVKEMVHSMAFLSNSCIIEGQTKPCINTDEFYRDGTNESPLSMKDFNDHEITKISKMRDDPKLLEHMSQSLFSSIHGSDHVKKGVFLQLLGGVSKITPTGTKLRGDINICLVGDPSTAKSQFLKIVTDFAPFKAVYASGKASSASGLTAAVVKDTDGGFVIEAGALMLADRGICCIDEFDKMELKDQVAIHEAMEQQTISLTKAGVSATLNARASILAAANPVGGSYNVNRDLRANVNLSLPILSRFDLFFTIIDPQDKENDRAIINKILHMHQEYANSTGNIQNMYYSFDDIKLYLRFARKYNPKIPLELEDDIVKQYVHLRTDSHNSKKSWRITVRQLESLIRLSEAIARAHGSEVVKREYVETASNLIQTTIVYVGDSDQIDLGKEREDDEQLLEENRGQLFEAELEPSQEARLSITVMEYDGLTKLILRKLREETENPNRQLPAMKRIDLVDWYLRKCVDQISGEEELIKKKKLFDKVLDRLIQVENLLLRIKEDGMLISPEQQSGEDPDQTLITLNPHLLDEDIYDEIFLQ